MIQDEIEWRERLPEPIPERIPRSQTPDGLNASSNCGTK